MYITANCRFPSWSGFDGHGDTGVTGAFDLTAELQAYVRTAGEDGTPLRIAGSGSKDFYGRSTKGEPLDVRGHRGIVEYEPTELVLTARGGTPLAEIESALAEHGQMLPFEPPHFGPNATLGGTIACGLSGPRRPYAGAARDFVLGTRVLTGTGNVLSFGGQVMKNVAGYDLSRLMCGALGTLGVLLEVSLKVLPRPAEELTNSLELSSAEAAEMVGCWSTHPLPLSAVCHDGQRLHVRLSGAASAVRAARQRIGGEPHPDAESLWRRIREHRHAFFEAPQALWRVSVPAAAPDLNLPGRCLAEWGGAQRWLHSDVAAERIRAAAQRAGGHATLFRGGDRNGEVFHPLQPSIAALHRRLKDAFDPKHILNPGRMYADI